MWNEDTSDKGNFEKQPLRYLPEGNDKGISPWEKETREENEEFQKGKKKKTQMLEWVKNTHINITEV